MKEKPSMNEADRHALRGRGYTLEEIGKLSPEDVERIFEEDIEPVDFPFEKPAEAITTAPRKEAPKSSLEGAKMTAGEHSGVMLEKETPMAKSVAKGKRQEQPKKEKPKEEHFAKIMITQADMADLGRMGYTDVQIEKLRLVDAQQILEQNIAPKDFSFREAAMAEEEVNPPLKGIIKKTDEEEGPMTAGEKRAMPFFSRLFRMSPELVLLSGGAWIAWLLYTAPAYRIGYQKAISRSMGLAVIVGIFFYLLRRVVASKTEKEGSPQEHDESADYSTEAEESTTHSYFQETNEQNADPAENVSYWPLSLFFAVLAGSLGRAIIRHSSFPSPAVSGATSGIVMGLFIFVGLFIARQVIHKINAANSPRGRKLAFSWFAAGIGLVVSLAVMYPFYMGPRKGPENSEGQSITLTEPHSGRNGTPGVDFKPHDLFAAHPPKLIPVDHDPFETQAQPIESPKEGSGGTIYDPGKVKFDADNSGSAVSVDSSTGGNTKDVPGQRNENSLDTIEPPIDTTHHPMTDSPEKAPANQSTKSQLIIKDPATGLTWTYDANLPGSIIDWEAAVAFIDQLNRMDYAGRNDWRFPSKNELQTLGAHIRDGGLSAENIQNQYWSGTFAVGSTDTLASVDFKDGYVWYIEKAQRSSLWPVAP
jgi:Protein of unknown function (DUF1566)